MAIVIAVPNPGATPQRAWVGHIVLNVVEGKRANTAVATPDVIPISQPSGLRPVSNLYGDGAS